MVLSFHLKHIPHTLYKYISTHATFHVYLITLIILCLYTNQGNGDAANGDTFSLQELYDFVQRMLFATEETKMTLRAEIEEAKYALRPWPIETIVMRQLDRDTCTCEEIITSEAKAEEIAAEIGKTLMHSQQLREKLAANLYKERQSARKPDIREIYVPKPLKEPNSNNAAATKRPRRSVSQQRLPSEPRKSGTANFRSASTARPVNKNADENAIPRRRAGSVIRNAIEPSKDNMLAMLNGYKPPKPQINFILANKMSVRGKKGDERSREPSRSRDSSKNRELARNREPYRNREPSRNRELSRNRETGKSQGDLRKVAIGIKRSISTFDKSTSTSARSDEIDTLSELDRLIRKFDVKTDLNSSDLRKNCPIHAENASSVIEEKVTTSVDAVEGLDRFGVPSNLIKILKTYHAYIKQEVFHETQAVTKKRQEAANDFLANFDRVSKKKQPPHLAKYQNLLTGMIDLCGLSFKPDLTHHELKHAKSKYVDLEPLYNDCNIKKTAGEITFVRAHNDEYAGNLPFDLNNWISNGIWNYMCIPDFKDIFGTHCTRYSDRTQLMHFQDLVQKVQRKVYETELIELLLLSVTPNLTGLFVADSREIIDLYKLLATIAQIVNPRVPVLATTESDD